MRRGRRGGREARRTPKSGEARLKRYVGKLHPEAFSDDGIPNSIDLRFHSDKRARGPDLSSSSSQVLPDARFNEFQSRDKEVSRHRRGENFSGYCAPIRLGDMYRRK